MLLSSPTRRRHRSPVYASRRVTRLAFGFALLIITIYLFAQTRITGAIPDDARLNPRHMSDYPGNLRDTERYLAYLPHSGLSNQRIELANALLLASMLNRTLIVPPAFLGNVIGWAKSDIIYDHLGWLTNASIDFDKLCQTPTAGNLATYVQRSRCSEYRSFAAIAWTDLHDLGQLMPDIRIREQSFVSLSELQRELGVSDAETYVHEDQQLYDWRLYESKEEARALLKSGKNYIDSFTGRRYYKVYSLEYWQQRPERLLQLGGIFSSTRFSIVSPAHLAMKAKIAAALLPRRDTPLGQAVANIIDYLGGPGSFVSVHIRTGDSPFRKNLKRNLFTFAKDMAELTGALPPREADFAAASMTGPASASTTLSDTAKSKQILLVPPEKGLNQPPWSTVCRNLDPTRKTKYGARTTIYMATDYRTPRSEDSHLLPWFTHYPCTLLLEDMPEYLFEPLHQLHDLVNPAKSLRSFLIPLIDGMVAAHGSQVFTTPRSTYSRYIGDMNRAWIK